MSRRRPIMRGFAGCPTRTFSQDTSPGDGLPGIQINCRSSELTPTRGLPMTAAFHSTTLTYWRRRLAALGRSNRMFRRSKRWSGATAGALTGRTRRSVRLHGRDDAVATQDTVIELIAAIRRAARCPLRLR
jgi:hypothetical protein